MFHDVEFGNDFLDMAPKAQGIKRIGRLHFIKIKNFSAPKDIVESEKETQNGRNGYKSYILQEFKNQPQCLNRPFSLENLQIAR